MVLHGLLVTELLTMEYMRSVKDADALYGVYEKRQDAHAD